MGVLDLLAERVRDVEAIAGDDVPSPCVSICRMDPETALCEGCLRTLDEIAAWGRMDDATKREVWQAIGYRLAREQEKP
ncbi:MAG: DUF1289 domain-containing protein [Ramlibacter sp.]